MSTNPLCVEAEPIRRNSYQVILTAHQPVEHNDGKPPWCNHCGKTAEHEVPATRFDSMVTAHRKAVSGTRVLDRRVPDTDAADD